jgi:hypothetical protein
MGAFEENVIDEIAESLYRNYKFEDETREVRLIAIGKTNNRDLPAQLTQILFTDILHFIFVRFNEYRMQKESHQQWDDTGKELWDLSSALDEHTFIKAILTRLT